MRDGIKTSESVTAGHPDKVCDLIAASILDEAIRLSSTVKQRPRVAMEVSAKGDTTGPHGTLMAFGEVTLPKGISLNFEKIIRSTIQKIGYSEESYGFHRNLEELIIRITQQSSEIDHGVSKKGKTGAGDQGFMIGGAIDDGPEYMPFPIFIANAMTRRITDRIRSGDIPFLKPDAKAQIVMNYHNGKAIGVEHVTVAVSHAADVDISDVRKAVLNDIVKPILEAHSFKVPSAKRLIINGAGPWHVFGPLADAGTTNRKIIVDSYGGFFPHGGGGFNGKDPTKVDLSGAVGARYVAKNLVANKLATKVQVEVTYAIGQPDPLGVEIETFGTENVSQKEIEKKAKKILDLSVDGIIEGLNLFQPIYEQAAAGGFFGRPEFPWERVVSV